MLLLFIINLIPIAQAAVYVDHCSNCGNVLVGAAKVEFDKIRWEGGSIPDNGILQVLWASTEFGFTGASKHNPFKLDPTRITYIDFEANKWLYWGHSLLAIWSVDPNDVSSMGFYFSPTKAGTSEVTYSYDVIGLSSKSVKLTGIGVADDSRNPVLGLNVTPLVNNEPLNGITDIPVTNNNEVVFIVNPVHRKNDKNELIQPPTGVEKPNYVMVEVFASTKPSVSGTTTECSKGNGSVFLDKAQGQNPSSITFNGRLLELANGTVQENYYQSIMGEQSQPSCNRYYYFLVSLGSSFKFSVQKQRESSTDYVEYSFFIRGHYGVPESHKTFSLHNSSIVTPPPTTTKTLNITVVGNGSVSSSTEGICTATTSPNQWNCKGDDTFSVSPAQNGQISVKTTSSGSGGCALVGQQIRVTFGNDPQLTCQVSFVGTSNPSPTITQPADPTNQKPAETTGNQMSAIIQIMKDGQPVNDATITPIIAPTIRGRANDTSIAAYFEITFKQHGNYTVSLKDANGNIISQFNANNVSVNDTLALGLPTSSAITKWTADPATKTLKAELSANSTEKFELKPLVSSSKVDQSWNWTNATPLNSIAIQPRAATSAVKACIALKHTSGEIPLTTTTPPLMLQNKDSVTLVLCSGSNNPSDTQYGWSVITPPKPNTTIGNPEMTYISQPINNQLVLDSKTDEYKTTGIYTVNLIARSGNSVDVVSVNIVKSDLSSDFSTATNAQQVTLTPVSPNADWIYTWWQEGKTDVIPLTANGGVAIALLNDPTNKTNSTFFLQVRDNNGQQSTTANVVNFKTAKDPTPKVAVSLPQQGVLTFNLDASESCDEDNLPNATDLTMKNACDDNLDIQNRGIATWSWVAGQVNPTTGVQVAQPNFGKQESITTVTLTDALGTANTVQVPVKLTVTDDDLNMAKSSSIDVTLTLNRPKAEGFTVQQTDTNNTKMVTATFNTELSKSSYSYSTSINGQTSSTATVIAGTGSDVATSIASCAWQVDNDLPVNGCSSFNTQVANGEHTISLTVTDNYGLKSIPATQKIFVGEPLIATKDNVKITNHAIANDGKFIQGLSSEFFGGVCVVTNGESCSTWNKQATGSLSSEKQVAYFKVAIKSDDISSIKSFLLVTGKELGSPYDGGADTQYFVYNDVGYPEDINLYGLPETWLPELTRFPKQRTDNNVLEFQVGLTSINFVNQLQVLYVFVGYLRNDDSIVYSPMPLTLIIESK